MRIVAAVLSVLWIVLAGTLWPASAWNDTGHQVVALIAWDNLAPEPRSKLVAIMRQAEPATRLPSLFPEDKRAMEVRAREFFRRAATWPDLICSVPELHQIPRGTTATSTGGRTRGARSTCPTSRCIQKIFWSGSTTSTKFPRIQPFRPASARSASRGSCIWWATFTSRFIAARASLPERKGDHGGQDFELAPRSPPRHAGERYSLHAYWDDMLTGLCPGGRASDWATMCGGGRPSSCPSIRGRSMRESSSRDSSTRGPANRSSPPRAPIRPASAVARSRPPTIGT